MKPQSNRIMISQRRPVCATEAFGFALLLFLVVVFNAQGDQLAARSDDFVNSIGVCTHAPYGGYPIYANTNMVTTNLAALGIRFTRCDGHNENWEWDYWNSLYTNYGIRRTEIFWAQRSMTNWAISNMVAFVDKYPAMMAGVEGPNETDSGWMTYDNTNFPQATILFQNDLFNAMKADSMASNFPVLAPSVGNPLETTNLVGCDLNYENMHSYANGLLPDNGLSSYWIYWANTIITPSSPVIATESGWHTAVNLTNSDEPGVSQRAQGKYVPRLFGEYWNQGVVRAHIYELLDEGTNMLNSEDCYGIVQNNGTPKPAYTALQGMIALLADPGDSYTPGILNYSLSGSTNNVHQTVLQKTVYSFYLLLWQDVLCYNITNKTDITNNTVAVTVNIPTDVTSVLSYSYNDAGNLATNTVNISNNSISLNVPDSVLYVKLYSPTPITPAYIKDNADATGIIINGTWIVSTATSGYYGPNYLQDEDAGGGKSVQFTPTIATSGYYDVYARWTSGSNRATNAPIDVNYDGGKTTFYENQQTDGGTWVWLGTFQFVSGTSGNVTVRDDGASGYVIADAVEFIMHCPIITPSITSAIGGDGQVALTWTATSGAVSYSLERSTNSSSPYVVIANPTTTNYTDSGLTSGSTYFYSVASINACSQQSGYSAYLGTTTIPATPTELNATPGNGRAILSWNSTMDASSYNLKMSTTSGGPYATITNITVTAFTNTSLVNGTTYYYVVSALNTSGESTNSSQVCVTPESITIIKDNSDTNGITITGVWYISTNGVGYYGTNYLQDGAAGGGKSVQFTPTIATAGYYDVYARWTSGTLRATNAPIDVNYSGGKTTFYENEQNNGGTWFWLGTFYFNAGTSGNETVRDDGASSYVIADAVEFILN